MQGDLPQGGDHGGFQDFEATAIEVTDQLFWPAATIRARASDASKQAAGSDHRIQQTSGSNSASEFQAICDQPFCPKMLCQRPHDVVEPLAHQDDASSRVNKRFQLTDAFGFKVRFQFVLEVLLAKQIKAITTDAPQYRMHNSGCEDPMSGIENRPEDGH